MNDSIARKLANVVAAVSAGADIRDAFEAQFGAGSYERLADMLHDQFRAQAVQA